MDVFVLVLLLLSYFSFLSITNNANLKIWSVIILFLCHYTPRCPSAFDDDYINLLTLTHNAFIALVIIIFSLYFLFLHTKLTLDYCQILGPFYYTAQMFSFGFYHILGPFQYTPHWLSALVIIIFFFISIADKDLSRLMFSFF